MEICRCADFRQRQAGFPRSLKARTTFLAGGVQLVRCSLDLGLRASRIRAGLLLSITGHRGTLFAPAK